MIRTALLVPVCLLLLGDVARGQCEQSKVLAADGGQNDHFGEVVDISDDFAIVGAVFSDGVGTDSGAAYLLERQADGSWIEVQKLLASDETADDRFGHSVAIDFRYAVVGARYNDDAGYGSGSVYVFQQGSTSWDETAYLTAGDEVVGALFGHAVDVNGQVIIVGAFGDPEHGFHAGAAYIYESGPGGWTETAKLVSSEIAMDHRFGRAVSVYDGPTVTRALVGAAGVEEGGVQTGAAYVFERSGSSWTEVARLVPSDGGEIDLFGAQVAIHGDLAVVGAQLHDGVGTDSGAVYVYEREPGGTWPMTAKLEASDVGPGSFFGASVDAEDDTILVGAWPHDGGRGKVYIFEDFGQGWVESTPIVASDAQVGDHFGAVGLSGNRAIIGARGVVDSDGDGDKSGAAYVLSNLHAIRPYGQPCPGAGGFVPRFSISGCAEPGGDITFSLREGPGGALTLLIVGFAIPGAPLPFNGCSIYVDPFLALLGPYALGGANPGEGDLDLPASLPIDIGLGSIAFQWFCWDPTVPGNWAISNGVELTVEQP